MAPNLANRARMLAALVEGNIGQAAGRQLPGPPLTCRRHCRSLDRHGRAGFLQFGFELFRVCFGQPFLDFARHALDQVLGSFSPDRSHCGRP